VDHGKAARCCQRATPDEIAEAPERFDCGTCELKRRRIGLWSENVDAWEAYRLLSGRIVGLCELRGFALEQFVAGWAPRRVLDLLRRLDVVLSILEPETAKR